MHFDVVQASSLLAPPGRQDGRSTRGYLVPREFLVAPSVKYLL